MYKLAGLWGGILLAGGIGSALDPLSQTKVVAMLFVIIGAALLGLVFGKIAEGAVP